jgi:hypothetical protein
MVMHARVPDGRVVVAFKELFGEEAGEHRRLACARIAQQHKSYFACSAFGLVRS